jgi:hypothetical protein
MPHSSTIWKLKNEAYKQEPIKLIDHILCRCFLLHPTSQFCFVSLFPELYLLCHLFIFFENVWLHTWMGLQTHTCTRALLSWHWPTTLTFHTQKLLRPWIPGRRALDWTSFVPWPTNSSVTSVIYKFSIGLRSYPLPYYGPLVMRFSMVYILH